jgi:hypothetical protein
MKAAKVQLDTAIERTANGPFSSLLEQNIAIQVYLGHQMYFQLSVSHPDFEEPIPICLKVIEVEGDGSDEMPSPSTGTLVIEINGEEGIALMRSIPLHQFKF